MMLDSSSSPPSPSSSKRWRRFVQIYWTEREYGGALWIYFVVSVADLLAHFLLFPQLDLTRDATLEEQAQWGVDEVAAGVISATTMNGTSIIQSSTPRVPLMVGSLTLRTFLHILYSILPWSIFIPIYLVRTVSPGYLQDLNEISDREWKQKERRRKEKEEKEEEKRREKEYFEQQARLYGNTTTMTVAERLERLGSPSALKLLTSPAISEQKNADDDDGDTDIQTDDEQPPPSCTSIPFVRRTPPPPPANPPMIPLPPSTASSMQPSAILLPSHSSSSSSTQQQHSRLITFDHTDDTHGEEEELDLDALELHDIVTHSNNENTAVQRTNGLTTADSSNKKAESNAESNTGATTITTLNVKPEVRLSSDTYCSRCESNRPPRAGHCPFCHTCVLQYDHHCGVIGACVGLYNYRFFLLFLFFASVSLMGLLLLCCVWAFQIPFYDHTQWSEWPIYICFFLAAFYVGLAGLPTACLLINCCLLYNNVTFREHTAKVKKDGVNPGFYSCCIRPFREIWFQPLVWRTRSTPNDSNTQDLKAMKPNAIKKRDGTRDASGNTSAANTTIATMTTVKDQVKQTMERIPEMIMQATVGAASSPHQQEYQPVLTHPPLTTSSSSSSSRDESRSRSSESSLV